VVTPFAHLLLEWLAYAVGGAIYWRGRELASQPPEAWRRLGIAAGAVAGAALGSKLLYWLDYREALAGAPLVAWLSGKTIVGGLLGGLIGVETVKKAIGWSRSTGDAFAVPLLVGIVIGRLGCQLADVHDLTYGTPTALPWGWDYGDGVPRHPVSLYEIVALFGLCVPMLRRSLPNAVEGDRFRALMVAYLAIRLVLDFLKPPYGAPATGVPVPGAGAGLTMLQWACVAGLAYYARDVRRWLAPRATTAPA
jgi:phosphatidylglycerol:prolipoprotein diacylglycerol transferase